MTRHIYKGRNPKHTVIVGWDKPMRTFFAQVITPMEDDLLKHEMLLWAGVSFDEVTSIQALRKTLAEYAELTSELAEQLELDKYSNPTRSMGGNTKNYGFVVFELPRGEPEDK